MPALSFASIDVNDDSVDFGRMAAKARPAAAVGTTTPPRTLILAPPSIAAHEERLQALFATTCDRAASDLQMLDRLAAGHVPLAPRAYDAVLVLTGADGGERAEALGLLSRRSVYAALVPAMKSGAALRFQDGARLGGADAREAVLAGLVEKDGVFEKVEEEEAAAVVPLRLKKKAAAPAPPAASAAVPAVVSAVPAPAPAVNAQGKRPAVVLDLGEYSDGDELVDEDSLLTAEERNRPPQQPPACNVDGQKRRKPCKDCTCGLAERLEEEDRTRRSQADRALQGGGGLKLDANDLNELDFTVQGKTGSCNSCSLGDAFRCSTCPYIGLPAFQPGEEVKILSGLVQL